jgi:hypothetical protein
MRIFKVIFSEICEKILFATHQKITLPQVSASLTSPTQQEKDPVFHCNMFICLSGNAKLHFNVCCLWERHVYIFLSNGRKLSHAKETADLRKPC